jgi:hypothetical protein
LLYHLGGGVFASEEDSGGVDGDVFVPNILGNSQMGFGLLASIATPALFTMLKHKIVSNYSGMSLHPLLVNANR